MKKLLKFIHLAILILLCIFVIVVSLYFSKNNKQPATTKVIEKIKENSIKSEGFKFFL